MWTRSSSGWGVGWCVHCALDFTPNSTILKCWQQTPVLWSVPIVSVTFLVPVGLPDPPEPCSCLCWPWLAPDEVWTVLAEVAGPSGSHQLPEWSLCSGLSWGGRSLPRGAGRRGPVTGSFLVLLGLGWRDAQWFCSFSLSSKVGRGPPSDAPPSGSRQSRGSFVSRQHGHEAKGPSNSWCYSKKNFQAVLSIVQFAVTLRDLGKKKRWIESM